MEQLSFIPNSPTLMNAGDELQQLSACFVDSPDDYTYTIFSEALVEARGLIDDDGRVPSSCAIVLLIDDFHPALNTF